jgi:hypothetical protein
MEERNEYDYVGTNQNLRVRYEQKGCTNPVYAVPNPEMLDQENEYEALQTDTLKSSKQPSRSEQHTNQDKNSARVTVTSKDVCHTGTKRGCIVICILMTVMGVITFVALAIGALSMRGSSTAQLASAQASQDYTHLMEEISALKSFISQLNMETQQNLSKLHDRLSSSGYSLSLSANSLSNSAYLASLSINRLSTSVSTASSRASRNSYTASRLSSSAIRLSTSLFTASSRAYWNSYSISWMSRYTVSSLSSKVSRVSTSLALCTSC